MTKDCPICCETFSKFIRKPIECPSCQYEACMKCCQTYLTSQPNAECMQCHNGWNREFIDTQFPMNWRRGEYASHRKTVLFDREKAQLPESQHLVQNYRTTVELEKRLEEERREKARLKKRLRDLEISRWNTRERIERIKRSRFQTDGRGNFAEPHEARTFIRACAVDGCRGFLSTSLKCGTCETYACADCFGVIGKDRHGEHTCHPDDVATAKLIRKESRPCPKCGIRISKIDGCDQMYCVSCRTPFSWRTGAIVQGTIHNPHYFEMLRRESANGEIPRQPGDGGGNGGCPPENQDPGHLSYTLSRHLKNRGFKTGPVNADILRAQRHICHLYHDTMRPLRHRIDFQDENTDLRLAYLLGTLDEPTFRKKLVQREKAAEKRAALHACYGARVQMTAEIFQAYLNNQLDEQAVLDRLHAIHRMMHEFLTTIKKRFQCTVDFGSAPDTLVIEHSNEEQQPPSKRPCLTI